MTDSTELVENQLTEFDEAYLKQVGELPRGTRLIVERLSAQIKSEGLTIEEACLTCNIDIPWLEKAIERYPIIARILQKKELEFRTELMRPLIKKARVDDKMAQYLLELRTPKQKKNAPDDNAGDMLAAVIKHIQHEGDSTPLVKRESSTTLVVAKAGSGNRLIRTIQTLLKPSDTLA